MRKSSICVVCGEQAQGYAMVGGDRVCHGDNQFPSCYEIVQRDVQWWVPWRWEHAKYCFALERARQRHPSSRGVCPQ